MEHNKWSLGRLKEEIRVTIINNILEGTLDFAEVAVGDKDRYKALRSRVLKLFNDGIRHIHKEIDENYEVVYTELGEDVINITDSRRR